MDNDDKRGMKRESKPLPFPHKQVRTKRRRNYPLNKLADDLLNWLAWEFVGPEDWYWIFRGVRNESYPLESSLDRKINSRGKEGYVERRIAEDYLLRRFKKAAHHFIKASMIPANTDKLEWLALMQHYGVPTRLLDFTRSPYVACFFALEEIETEKKSTEHSNCAIWAVDTNWLVSQGSCRISKGLPRHIEKDSLLDSLFMAENFDTLYYRREKSAQF